MRDKNIRAVVILAEYPKGENPYGAQDWNRVKKAGARLHQVVKEVDPAAVAPEKAIFTEQAYAMAVERLLGIEV
ncbi:MAG: hypothetical protein HGB17_06455, partial [Syntrophobacteraceae bacterium]|nr:hypothetical protein [Syntrophobacteraceae bacterium]